MIAFKEYFNLITEADITKSGYYTETDDADFILGSGIPDLTGNIKNFYGRVRTKDKSDPTKDKLAKIKTYAWNTPLRNIDKSYVYKAAILNDSNNEDARTVIFYKVKAGFDPNRETEKLIKFIKSEFEGGFDEDVDATDTAMINAAIRGDFDEKDKNFLANYKDEFGNIKRKELLDTLRNHDKRSGYLKYKSKDADVSITTEIADIIKVNPKIIKAVGSRFCKYYEFKAARAEWAKHQQEKIGGAGAKLSTLANKVYGDGTDDTLSGSRSEIEEEIKKRANKLAKEKMNVLISNGVPKEQALEAAKAAYKMFKKKFYDESSLSKISAGSITTSKRADHPLLSKQGETIKAMRATNSKKAENKEIDEIIKRLRAIGSTAYREYINKGEDEEKARMAMKVRMYNELISRGIESDKAKKITLRAYNQISI